MKTLPEYHAYFMRTQYGMDFKAMGANDYLYEAHMTRTDLEHYSQFVYRSLLSSYKSYYVRCGMYEKTYEVDNKKKEIQNCKRRKKNRYNKAFRYDDMSKYSFWFVVEKIEEGFDIQYWSSYNKGAQMLSDGTNIEAIQNIFIRAYVSCNPGIYYSHNIDCQIIEDFWGLEQYENEAIAKAKEILSNDECISNLSILIDLIRLSKHAFFNLENAESSPLIGSDEIAANIVNCYAVDCKEYESINDDEFVVNAFKICIYAGIISILAWKKNANKIDYTVCENVETLFKDIVEFGSIQKWEELLFTKIPILNEVNEDQQLLFQITTVIQYTYTLFGKLIQATQDVNQIIECYCALYEYGQHIGMYFQVGK